MFNFLKNIKYQSSSSAPSQSSEASHGVNKNLNPKIFDADFEKSVEQVAVRKGFGEGLLSAGEKDARVVGLCADLTESTQMHLFKAKFPTRFVEVGVAEQNLASLASGMSAMGKIPFISSYAMFSPGRNWEQIRTTICYNDRKVIIVGSHAGISVGPDGGTHQAIEDIALMRVVPNMTVVVPCDSIEARKATLALALDAKSGGTDTPAYLRLSREKTPIITNENTPFVLGKAQAFFDGASMARGNGNQGASGAKNDDEKNTVGIIACGHILYQALKVAKEFSEKSSAINGAGNDAIKIKVLNLATIKPLDNEAIIALAKETGAIVTVEEHQVAGGMGSAVAELLAREYPTPIEFVGIEDKFGQSGTQEELIKHYGIGEDGIKNAVLKVMKRKVSGVN